MSKAFTGLLCRSLLLVLLVLLAGAVAVAQNTGLSGTVTDPQGAVVPGADVTLVNSATGQRRVAVSDDEGRYSFTQVVPGVYELRAELAGFKTTVVSGVQLRVDTPVVQDLMLALGAVSETITVASSSAEALVNQVNATIGNTFVGSQIADLPLESRNVVDLLSVQPGVTSSGEVAGARSDQSNLTLDGIDVNEQQTGAAFTPVLRVTPDSVQEFRVTVSNPVASQGRSSGAQVSLVTKGGTNEWHGSVYEFHRNTVTTANEFWNNRVIDTESHPECDGLEPGQTGGRDCAIPRPALIRNLFGGSVGGPIKKDKAFFFFNYEGRTDRSQTSSSNEVPLPHLGQGNIRYQDEFGVIQNLTPADLNNIYPELAALTGSAINPAAQQILGAAASRYANNDTGAGDGINTGTFRFNASTPLDWNTYIAKVDFNLTDTQQLFVRGNYQWDNASNAARWPDTPSPGTWSHPFGVAVGHTWSISPNLINTFRYGLTRQAFSNQGDSGDNSIWFRFVYWPRDYSRTLARTTPVHNFTNDTSWIKGDHTLQFGTNIRLIKNQRDSYANAWDDGGMNPSFYELSGAVVSDPLFGPPYNMASSSASPYENAATALIGRYTQYSGNFTFGIDGNILPLGTPSEREFATEEFELYFEDSWQVNPGFTLNLGLRWGYNSPVNETLGYQVKPTTSLGGYLDKRIASSLTGVPYNDLITIDTAGPYYGKDGYYEKDFNNFSPRVSFAWTPQFDDGVLGTIFGTKGQTVLRGGFAMMYDRIGSALAVQFDLNNTLGFSSSDTIAANTYNVTDRPGPLFTGLDQDIRSLPNVDIPAKLVFPLITPDDEDQRIESSLDDTLTTPVNYNWNFSLGREFENGLFVEASYIGRSARDLLATRDVMALNNIVDPQSGMDWYTAAGMLAQLRLQDVPISEVQPIAYFQNLFPNYSTATLSPTQRIYRLASRDGFDILDWTYIQLLIDDRGVVPNMFFHPQYAALSAFSTIVPSDYHAFTLTARQRFGDSSIDFNYTFSKSIDWASGLQTSGAYGAAFILNPLLPEDSKAVSDFDMTHIINSAFLWSMPFGRGKRYGADWNGFVDALLGGWSFNGLFRWNSGLPRNAPFDRAQWATNWNVQSWGTQLRDPRVDPSKAGEHPNYWADKEFSYNSFRNALPGETGQRNLMRLTGYFTIDFGLFKSFTMPYNEGHKLQFRWEVFNATNTNLLGSPLITRSTFGLGQDPELGSPPPNWGNITSTQGDPRVMQFGLKYIF